jgi:GT2 family glycosyltransferase
VVDNGSSDGSQEMVGCDYPEAHLIANAANRGFGAANNQAISSSGAPLILLLNSDAVLEPGALRAMLDVMRAHPECGAVVPRLAYPDGRYQASFTSFPSLAQDALLLAGLGRRLKGAEFPGAPARQATADREVDWASGACLMLRRDALRDGVAFDEAYRLYVEETDLCRRLWDNGWTVRFCHGGRAVHRVGASSALRPDEQPTLLWESRARYYAKHLPAWQGVVLSAMVRCAYGARFVAWRLRGLGGRDAEAWRRKARSAGAVAVAR